MALNFTVRPGNLHRYALNHFRRHLWWFPMQISIIIELSEQKSRIWKNTLVSYKRYLENRSFFISLWPIPMNLCTKRHSNFKLLSLCIYWVWDLLRIGKLKQHQKDMNWHWVINYTFSSWAVLTNINEIKWNCHHRVQNT